jgi:opacity protein-like surface antigen
LVKSFVWIAAGILGACGTAAAQEAFRVEPAAEILDGEDVAVDPPSAPDLPAIELPRSLADEPKADTEYRSFSIGAAGGYLNAKNADHGTWTGGIQARMRFGFLAAEASVQFHQSRYEGGDVTVTQYPVQLTAFFYILPNSAIRPYILGGVGWYYTRFDYTGAFASVSNRTEHIFGEHLGAGAELFLSTSISINADIRYIFLNPTTDQVLGGQFNYWQITAGLNFFF